MMSIWNRRRSAPPGPVPTEQTETDRTAAKDQGTESTQRGRRRGFATVEFAVVSIVFFFIVFATVDFGRAIFIYSELHTGVGDAAREMKVKTANGNTNGAISNSLIQHRVRYAMNPDLSPSIVETARPGLETATTSYSCTGGCVSGGTLNITGQVSFTPITLGFLQMVAPSIGPLTLTATTSVSLE
jgi:Flp pilus assembly protein TadG